MNRMVWWLLLAAAFVASTALAQTAPPAEQSAQAIASAPAGCIAAKTLEDLIKALDEAVSGPADKDRACLRQLLYPDSRLIPVGKTLEGSYAPHVLTVDGWIEAVKKRGSAAFYERQVKVKSETFGHIAHLWSTYEIRPTPDGKATVRGINSIQAVFDGTRWKVSQIPWQAETPTEAIPGQYLP